MESAKAQTGLAEEGDYWPLDSYENKLGSLHLFCPLRDQMEVVD